MQDALAAATLPDDLATCQRMIGELLGTVQQQRRENEQLRSRLEKVVPSLDEAFEKHLARLDTQPVE